MWPDSETGSWKIIRLRVISRGLNQRQCLYLIKGLKRKFYTWDRCREDLPQAKKWPRCTAAGHASSGPTGWHQSQASSSRTKGHFCCLSHRSQKSSMTLRKGLSLLDGLEASQVAAREAPSWHSLLLSCMWTPCPPRSARITHKPVRVPSWQGHAWPREKQTHDANTSATLHTVTRNLFTTFSVILNQKAGCRPTCWISNTGWLEFIQGIRPCCDP